MAQPAAILSLPPCRHAGADTDTIEGTNSGHTQSLEDPCLADRIQYALHATGHSPLRGIEILVKGRMVLLAGRVPSYYLKQLAQVTALAVPGTHQVQNDIEVIRLT